MESKSKQLEIAEQIRTACIDTAKEGFLDASMSGLCSEGAMEAAISAMQSLDLEKFEYNQRPKRDA
ncbi:MAG: acetyltransferase [Gracilimonas sp.]